MPTVRIIPCLDVKAGRVVKGIRFVDLKDVGDPVDSAKAYEKQGADELVFLDITASNEERGIMKQVVERTASACSIPVTVGGGLRSIEDIREILHAGAAKVSINTAALLNPELIREASQEFGSERIISAIDARYDAEKKAWKVVTYGGTRTSEYEVVEWAQKVASLGAGEILLTSMDRDGTKEGYDIEMTRLVAEATNLPVTASGGAGTLDHMVDAVLKGKASAVLAASIFHFGTYTIQETKAYLAKHGIQVR